MMEGLLRTRLQLMTINKVYSRQGSLRQMAQPSGPGQTVRVVTIWAAPLPDLLVVDLLEFSLMAGAAFLPLLLLVVVGALVFVMLAAAFLSSWLESWFESVSLWQE